MPRLKAILQNEFPYHVTARCINKDWFAQPLAEVWTIMSDQLFFIQRAFNVRIHAFVLMQNHFHLMISTPDANLSSAMQNFMQATSTTIVKNSNRINGTYGGRHSRSIIDSRLYFSHCYKYVYRNPVAIGVCKKVEDYPFSTLHGLLGRQTLYIPVAHDDLLFSDVEKTLYWLNQEPKKEHSDAIKSAMKKPRFKLRKDPNTKKPHSLESELY